MLLERVYRRITHEFIERHKRGFTQRELSAQTSLSIGTVNYALKPLFRIGAATRQAKGFTISSLRKLLSYWAVRSDMMKRVVYTTRTGERVHDVEMHIPSRCIPTAYSAHWLRFNEAPADYDQVHLYGDQEALKRLHPPSREGAVEVIVLRGDEELGQYGAIAPLGQVFVDTWNLPGWMSSEFLKKMEERLFVE